MAKDNKKTTEKMYNKNNNNTNSIKHDRQNDKLQIIMRT
jgi:hypothetical protein